MQIFSCSIQTLSCSLWDLVSWPGIEPGPPALGAQSLSYWTFREVSLYFFHSSVKWNYNYTTNCGTAVKIKENDMWVWCSRHGRRLINASCFYYCLHHLMLLQDYLPGSLPHRPNHSSFLAISPQPCWATCSGLKFPNFQSTFINRDKEATGNQKKQEEGHVRLQAP